MYVYPTSARRPQRPSLSALHPTAPLPPAPIVVTTYFAMTPNAEALAHFTLEMSMTSPRFPKSRLLVTFHGLVVIRHPPRERLNPLAKYIEHPPVGR